MKAGLTIEELATEVMRQKDAKADYIVNTSMLAMEHCGIAAFLLKHCPTRGMISGQHTFLCVDIQYQRALMVDVFDRRAHHILHLIGTENAVFHTDPSACFGRKCRFSG